MKLDSETKFRKKLEKCGAILSGHFVLSSGRHSSGYIQCQKFSQNTKENEDACEKLAEKFGFDKYLKAYDVNKVISPAIGGITVGYQLALTLGLPFIFAERIGGQGDMVLRRGMEINPGDRVAIVEDVVTSGASVESVIKIVESMGGIPVIVLSLIDRSEKNPFDIPFFSLLKVKLDEYEVENCPMCKSGIKYVKPGSKL